MLRRFRRAPVRVSAHTRRRNRRGLPAGVSLETLEPRAMLTSFSYGGNVLALTIDNLDESLVASAAGSNAYTITSNDLFTGADIPGQITGAGTNTLSIATAAALGTVFVTDTKAGATFTFGSGKAGATYDADFLLSLAIPGSGTVNVADATTFSGAHSLSATAARIGIDAALSSGTGFLTLDADDGSQAVGVPAGVAIAAAGSVTTAGGAIDISGRGGDSILGEQVGVNVLGKIHAGDDGTTFGTLTISGVGGATTGELGGNHGVVLGEGAAVSTSGGALSITGRGADVNGIEAGVVVAGLIQTVSAVGHPGDVAVEGFGGGSIATPGSSGNYGIWVEPTGRVVTGAGNVSAIGHEGVGNTLGFFPFTDSPGLWFDNGSVQSTSGALSFTADSFWADIAAGGAIGTTATVSIRNLLAGQPIVLGADMNPVLGDIVASRIVVGRDDIQPVIYQVPAPDGSILLAPGTALELAGSSISLAAPIVTPGAEQVYRGPVHLGDITPSDVALTASAARFVSTIDGGGRSLSISGDAEFRGAVTGLSNLAVTGATTTLADVTTTGTQQYGGAVTLAAPLVTLTAAAGSFGGGVVGDGHSLAIDFGGTTAIDGSAFTGIAALSTGNGGTTTLAGTLSTSGTQSFGDPVTLVADTTLGTAGGDVVFSGTLDGARNLTLAAGAGAVRFQAAVGTGTPLASLLLSSAGSVTASATIAIDGSAPGAAANGLVVSGVANVDMQVAGSTVRNCAGSGILLLSSRDSSIGGFTISDNGAYGIYVSGNSPGTTIVGDTMISNAVGVYLAAAGGLTLDGGNLIVGNHSYGIYATGIATQTTRIVGNTVDGLGSGVYGVYLDDAKNIHLGETGLGNHIVGSMIGIQARAGLGSTQVVDNRVEHNGSGVVLSATRHLTMSGANRIVDNPSYGILAQGVFVDTTVSGATVSGSSVGVCLSAARGLVVDGGNVVQGNSAHALYATGDCTATTVTGNTFDGSGTGIFGLFLDGATGLGVGGTVAGTGNTVTGAAVGLYARGVLDGSTVRGNAIDDNGSGMVLSAASGLAVSDGNVVSHATSYGILVQGSSAGSTISGNTIDTNVAGVVLSGATGVAVEGANTITGSSAYGVYVGGASAGTRVTGNTIDGVGTGSYGVFLDGATGALLGDAATRNALSGWTIGVYARGVLDGTSLRANTVTGGTAGLLLADATGLTVEGGNRFTGASAYGILAQGDSTGTVLTGNTADQNVVGLWLSSATGLAVQDSNQFVANSSHGIYASGAAAGTRIVGNVVNGASLGSTGVFLDGVTGLVLGGTGAGEINTLTGNAVGISATGLLTGTGVVANIVSGNQSGLVLSSARGLAVSGGNHFVGSSAFGLYGTGDCDGTVVQGNQFESNSSGVVLENARRLTVVNTNRLVSNTAFGLYAKGDSAGTTVLGNVITGNGLNIDTSAAVGGTFQTA